MDIPSYINARKRRATILRLKKQGVVFIDEAHTYIEESVCIGRGTVVQAGVYIEGKTIIGRDCMVGPDVFMRNSRIANSCIVGFGAHIEDSVINKQCEIAHAQIVRSFLGTRTKARHFCYIGDAHIGKDCNIGAGAVFCNYDGEKKQRIILEDGVFVGSGTMLIAPLHIGKRAYIAAGSVITKDIPAGGTLVIARGQKHEHALADLERASSSTPTEIHLPGRYRRDQSGWHKNQKPEN